MKKKKDSAQVDLKSLRAIVEEAVLSAQEKARIPRVDPRKKENDERMRAAMKEASAREKAGKETYEKLCPHLQGSSPNSCSTGELTSIVWHQHSGQKYYTGVCTNCIRVFRPEDSDYAYQISRPTGNQPSTGGGSGPWGKMLRPNFTTLELTLIRPGTQEDLDFEIEMDKLSDEEVKQLYEGASELFKELKPVLDVDKVFGHK